MINTFVKSLKELFNPVFLLPGALLVLYQAFLFFVFFEVSDTVPRFFYETLVIGSVTGANLFSSVGAFLLAFSDELLVLGFLSVLWVAGFVWILFAYTHAQGEPKKIFEAIGKTVSNALKIVGLSVFLWIVLLLYVFVLALIIFFGVILGSLNLIAWILLGVWLFVGAVLYLKLVYLPIVFFDEQKKIRESVHLANEWTKKKLLGTIVVLFVSYVFSQIVGEIGLFASELAPEVELFGIIVLFVAFSITSSFSALYLTNYYFSQK